MFDTVLSFLFVRLGRERDHSVRSIQIAVYHNITLTTTIRPSPTTIPPSTWIVFSLDLAWLDQAMCDGD